MSALPDPRVTRRVLPDLVEPRTPADRLRSMTRTRPSKSDSRSTASSPCLAPQSAARRTSNSDCSAANKRWAQAAEPGRRLNASSADATASPAATRRRRTSSWLWWRLGWGRGGPRIPASGFSLSRPSATAQDTAARSRSQRADTFGTDTPSPRQRQMALRVTAGVSDCRRQRHSGSPSRVETT